MAYPAQDVPLIQIKASYWEAATADGLADGTTIVNTGLASEPSYLGHLIKVVSGNAKHQTRRIVNHPAGTNTITVNAPFTDSAGAAVQIVTGTLFVVISDFESDTVYPGTTTSAGAADGATLVDSGLATPFTVDDEPIGHTVRILTSATAALIDQEREIYDYDFGTSTLFFSIPFTAQVPSGTTYSVLRGRPSAAGTPGPVPEPEVEETAWKLADFDIFDTADLFADTERWSSEYISGAAHGSADINTTTASKLYINETAALALAAAEYGVRRLQQNIEDKWFTKVDASVVVTSPNVNPAFAGISVSRGNAWDGNNYVRIYKRESTTVEQICTAYNIAGAGAVIAVNLATTQDDIAFKIERIGNIWRTYYSLSLAPRHHWVLGSEIEDPTISMTSRTSTYLSVYNPEDAVGQRIYCNFDKWEYYVTLANLETILSHLGKAGGALAYLGYCPVGMTASTTVVLCPNLNGFPNDTFNSGYQMIVLKNANNPGVAPESERRDITDYVSATGQFTTAAFSDNVEASDVVLVIHNSVAAIVQTGLAYSSTVNPGGTAKDNLEQTLEDLGDMLAGAGITTFPAAADIGNGVSLAEAIRAILTSLVGSDDYDGYTNISNSANTSVNAIFQKFATLFAANGVNIFNPTIQGAARTDLELALAALATYISTGGAALSIQVNGQVAKDNLEQVWEDYLAVIGCDGANVFDPSIGGAARTTLDAAFAALGIALGAEYDGTPDLYDTIVTGLTTAGAMAVAGSILERLELLKNATLVNEIFTATASSTTSVTAAALKDIVGAYIDDVVVPLAGNMQGQSRQITAYDGTAILTVSPAWAEAPGAVQFAVVGHGFGHITRDLLENADYGLNALHGDLGDKGANDDLITRIGLFTAANNLQAVLGAFTAAENLKGILGDLTTTKNLGGILGAFTAAENLKAILGDLATTKRLGQILGALDETDTLKAILGALTATENLKAILGDLSTTKRLGQILGALTETDTLKAILGAYTAAAPLKTSVDEFHDDHGEPIAPDTSTSDSLHNIKHKDAGHTFAPATDSNEAIRDQLDDVHTDVGTAIAATDTLEAELAKVPKSDAAVSWNVTALQAIQDEAEDALEGENLDHLQAVTDGAGNFPSTAVDGSVISKIISKVAGGDTSSYDETTDSLEMLSDKSGGFSGDGGAAQDDSVKASLDLAHTDLDTIIAATDTVEAEIAKIPKSDAAVSWNVTALAAIEGEVEDELQDQQLDHLQALACADIVDPVDMTAEVVDNSVLANLLAGGDTSTFDRRLSSLKAISDALASLDAKQLILQQAFNTTTTTKNASITLFALDALGGTCKNVRVEFYLAADAAATFTPAWYATREGDPVTFVVRNYPAIVVIALPGAAGRYQFEYGDLPEGAQLEFRVAQDNNGNATNVIDSALTYESKL